MNVTYLVLRVIDSHTMKPKPFCDVIWFVKKNIEAMFIIKLPHFHFKCKSLFFLGFYPVS